MNIFSSVQFEKFKLSHSENDEESARNSFETKGEKNFCF